MAQVATELGIATANINLNQANVRKLAGKTSGAISMSDLRGKSSVGPLTITIGAATKSGATFYGFPRGVGGFPWPTAGSIAAGTPTVGGTVQAVSWFYEPGYYGGNFIGAALTGATLKVGYKITLGSQTFRVEQVQNGTNGVVMAWAFPSNSALAAIPKTGTVLFDISPS